MARSWDEAKRLKMKKRGRFATFSGKTAKFTEKIDPDRFLDLKKIEDADGNEDLVPAGRNVTVYVGKLSLSSAVINTGRGPDPERMQEYYARTRSFGEAIPLTKSERPDQELLRALKCEHHINYLNDPLARLDLFWNDSGYFWIELSHRPKMWRRSAIYKTKKLAEAFLESDSIRWVETISPETTCVPSE